MYVHHELCMDLTMNHISTYNILFSTRMAVWAGCLEEQNAFAHLYIDTA